MRKKLVTIMTLMVWAIYAPAFALQANDTMKSWRNTSEKTRAELIEQLLGNNSGAAQRGNILECLNETSAIPAHADLPIADVVKVCQSSGKAGQPV